MVVNFSLETSNICICSMRTAWLYEQRNTYLLIFRIGTFQRWKTWIWTSSDTRTYFSKVIWSICHIHNRASRFSFLRNQWTDVELLSGIGLSFDDRDGVLKDSSVLILPSFHYSHTNETSAADTIFCFTYTRNKLQKNSDKKQTPSISFSHIVCSAAGKTKSRTNGRIAVNFSLLRLVL